MVGRLARYLRIVGCDTAYARGISDAEILAVARNEGRILVTRDRALSARTPGSVLLTSPRIEEQWRAVRAAHPEVPCEVSFERCTACNGRLAPYVPAPGESVPRNVPWDRVKQGLPLFRCADCAHLYWEGTHTASIRARLHRWAEGGSS
jgi:uncharacterized protein